MYVSNVSLSNHNGFHFQVYYYILKGTEGDKYFNINTQTGEITTKVIFDREAKGAFALNIEARDGAASARPNSGGQPNSVSRLVRYCRQT